jgi:hypothetical protein
MTKKEIILTEAEIVHLEKAVKRLIKEQKSAELDASYWRHKVHSLELSIEANKKLIKGLKETLK